MIPPSISVTPAHAMHINRLHISTRALPLCSRCLCILSMPHGGQRNRFVNGSHPVCRNLLGHLLHLLGNVRQPARMSATLLGCWQAGGKWQSSTSQSILPGCLLLGVLVPLLALVLAERPVVLLLLLWVRPLSAQHTLAQTSFIHCFISMLIRHTSSGHTLQVGWWCTHFPAARACFFRSAATLADTLGLCQPPFTSCAFNAASPNFFSALAMRCAFCCASRLYHTNLCDSEVSRAELYGARSLMTSALVIADVCMPRAAYPKQDKILQHSDIYNDSTSSCCNGNSDRKRFLPSLSSSARWGALSIICTPPLSTVSEQPARSPLLGKAGPIYVLQSMRNNSSHRRSSSGSHRHEH